MSTWKNQTLNILRALVHSMEQLCHEQELKIAEHRIAGDAVKQAYAEGNLSAYISTMKAITDFVAIKDKEIAEDNASKDVRSKDYLREMCKLVGAKLPDNYGFLLLAAPFGTDERGLVYASSMERKDAINLLKEWLIKCGAEEDWMKHIK